LSVLYQVIPSQWCRIQSGENYRNMLTCLTPSCRGQGTKLISNWLEAGRVTVGIDASGVSTGLELGQDSKSMPLVVIKNNLLCT